MTTNQQSAADFLYGDFNISNFEGVRHLRFDQKWIFAIMRPSETQSASTYHISAKSDNARLSY